MPSREQLIWLFFSLSGRLSRAAYLLGGLMANLIPMFLLYRFTLTEQETVASGTWAILFLIAGGASIWSLFALTVKRLHDIARPGIMALVLFVPVLSIIAFVVLCILPSDPGPNRYGPAPNLPAPRQ